MTSAAGKRPSQSPELPVLGEFREGRIISESAYRWTVILLVTVLRISVNESGVAESSASNHDDSIGLQFTQAQEPYKDSQNQEIVGVA